MRQKTLTLLNDTFDSLPGGSFSSAFCAVYLFDFLDRLRGLGFPGNWYSILQSELSKLVESLSFTQAILDKPQKEHDYWSEATTAESLEETTGQVYYNLWKDFSKEEYYSQAFQFLMERLQRNNITLDGVGKAIDSGCGGGRYTVSLKKAGCRLVTGVDVSAHSIALARRMNIYPDDVHYLVASVLELPFEAESCDFVFSNGVLHHTSDTEKGLAEICRVLRPGGFCWLYLYGGKESLFWDIVDFCRRLLASTPQAYTQNLMKTLGYPPGRIFHRSDFFYVPINNRYSEEEATTMLTRAGFADCRRLRRGADHDWDEIIHHNPALDPYIYGEGEMRFIVHKQSTMTI